MQRMSLSLLWLILLMFLRILLLRMSLSLLWLILLMFLLLEIILNLPQLMSQMKIQNNLKLKALRMNHLPIMRFGSPMKEFHRKIMLKFGKMKKIILTKTLKKKNQFL